MNIKGKRADSFNDATFSGDSWVKECAREVMEMTSWRKAMVSCLRSWNRNTAKRWR